uniref:Methyltransferase like 15 n=1 Tax=Gorilla gorilla gorilla TaxID=9595 RepID=A0A2I2Z995_GORGO
LLRITTIYFIYYHNTVRICHAYPYFCRMYKECLSCWLESGIPNLGIWPKRIHTTAEKYEEYEAQKQTDQTQAQELCRSQDRDFETMAKLHTPVMVDEVVHCHHKKDRFFLDMTLGYSAVVQSGLTAASASWVQAILLPQPPE